MNTENAERITSFKNPRVQFLRSLLSDKSTRTETGLFITEGIRLAEEVLHAGITPHSVFYSEQLTGRGTALIQACVERKVELIELSPELMNRISETETVQGILMVVPQQSHMLPDSSDLVLILDQIRDPGNMGTILRTAAAAAIENVLVTPGTVDVYMPKVVRSAMGAHFRLAITQMSWTEITQYCKETLHPPLRIILADSGGGTDMWATDLKSPLAIVVGGEAEGVSLEGRESADALIHIPMPGKFESLNAGVAASILLFEVLRQRNS